MGVSSSAPPSRRDAAKDLSRLIEECLLVKVRPAALETFLHSRWRTISILAHQIHSHKEVKDAPADRN